MFLFVFVSMFVSATAFALTWEEKSYTDFADGIFTKTTSTVNAPEIKAGGITNWFNPGWAHRQPIILTYPADATQHQTRIDISSRIKNLISAGKLRSDGADIRFTDSDGFTSLPYWIDLSTDVLATATTTQVWVKVPFASSDTVKAIYMYYDNPSTATIFSNRYAVDDLYEDWNSGVIDTLKWSLGGSSNFQINSSSKYEGGYCVRSGPITHSQETSIQKTFDLEAPAIITFYWASSCQFSFDTDYLKFEIDGSEVPPQSCRVKGETIWNQVSRTLHSGNVTIKWTFKKDPSDPDPVGLDRGWLDNIVVRKSAAQPASDFSNDEEFFGQQVYSNSKYDSSVFNSGAENSNVLKSTWTVIQTDGSYQMWLRYSNTAFNAADGSPAWSSISNGAALNYKGQYFQYHLDLNANAAGTTTPVLIHIAAHYDSPPTRPNNFKGVAYSSVSVNWEWADNSGNEQGFRIYSDTSSLSRATGFLNFTDTDGLLYTIAPNVTYYLETNLTPNTTYTRFMVAFSTAGANIGRRITDNLADVLTVNTLAQPPQINSERFKWDTNDPDGDPGDNFHYEAINQQNFTTNSTFFFTSNIFSTGTAKAEYYRIIWDSSSAHTWLNTEPLWYAPTNFVFNSVTLNTVDGKPQLTQWLSFNTTNAYFHVQSYNYYNVPSGHVDVGPYYFNGCPSQITDLTATPSITDEGSVVLSWTAPTANSTFTAINAGRYIVKWAPSIITNDNGFDNAANIMIISTTSVVPGSLQRFTITGLTPGNPYGFAIKAVDSENNYGTLSTNVLGVLNTRAVASKVAKIFFMNSPLTTYVGLPTSVMSIECQDASGNHLRLFANEQLLLKTDGFQVVSSGRGYSEQSSPWTPTDSITILKGDYAAQFYYKDDTAGSHALNISNSDGSKSWTDANQSVNILPGKAVTFVADVGTTQDIGTQALITVRANDGYNPLNTSQDYIGGVIATTTLSNTQLVPATHYFTLSDAGQKIFRWQNSNTAGTGQFSVTEDNPQALNDIKFINTQGAFISASQGMIKRTLDAGSNWFAVNSTGTGNNLRSITIDASNNYVLGAGNAGIVVISTDAAQVFKTVDTGIGVDLYGIYFVDVSTVYACGNTGKIIKSTDSGNTWSANIGPGAEANRFNSIFFLNASTGYACANAGKAYKTSDGGLNWSSIDPGGVSNLYKIQFLDESIGYIGAAGGKVFKTINGGGAWADVSPAGSVINWEGMHFYNDQMGIVAGKDRTIFKTINGGTSWTQKISSAAIDLHGISFAQSDSNIVVTVGDNGMIYRSADGGNSWNQSKMYGQSTTVNWNGLIVTAQPIAAQLLQGRSRQAAVKLMARTLFGGTSRVTSFKVSLSGGTGADTDIQYVKLYRDSNNNGIFDESDAYKLGSNASFSGGNATVSGFTWDVNPQTTFFMILDIPTSATLNSTLGFQFGTDIFTVSAGRKLAQNGLPLSIPPVEIVPSSCTLNMVHSDLSTLTYTEVQQGQQGIFISSFSMITDRSNTPFRRMIIRRDGINNSDNSIDYLKLWYSPTSAWNDRNPVPISTATFSAGIAALDISTSTWGTDIIDASTTQYFFLTCDVSPNAVPYTPTTDARFWLSYNMTTAYFLLDPAGANGISPNVATYESRHFRISAAFDALLMDANNPPVAVNISQSEIKSFIPLKLQRAATGGSINWTRLRVNQLGTATDSDFEAVSIYRDTNGDNIFQSGTDALLGSTRFTAGVADINLDNPEDLTNTLTSFATYFISVTAAKRSTAGNTIQIAVSSQNFTLAGTDIVNGNVLTSPLSTINNFVEPVNVSITNLMPVEARIDEQNLLMAKITLWAYCSAVFTKIGPELAGTGAYTDVNAIKIYGDTDNNGQLDTGVDTLLGSGVYGADGKATINLTTTPTVYDSSYTVFLAYDLNPAGTPLTTIGFGLSDSQDTLAFPGEVGAVGKFGYFVSNKMKLLHKETPSVPALALSIGIPSGKHIGTNTVYYSNDPAKLSFVANSTALNGVAETKYALATYAIIAASDTPDVTGWLSTIITTASFSNLNLQHDTVYYLWVKAVSSDGYERATSVMLKIDLTQPDKPSVPTDTSPKAASTKAFMASAADKKALSNTSTYWVNWKAVTDLESGVALYEVQEKTDTSPVWHSIATTTVNQYMVNKDTFTDQGKFFYYRIRAQNFAGTWSDYSEASIAAYLSLPAELIKDLSSFPNPFDSRKKTATITFVLNQSADIEFRIYDLLGGKVKQWNYGGVTGPNNLTWDGTDENGNKVAAGMYIMHLEVRTSDTTEKKNWKIGVIH